MQPLHRYGVSAVRAAEDFGRLHGADERAGRQRVDLWHQLADGARHLAHLLLTAGSEWSKIITLPCTREGVLVLGSAVTYDEQIHRVGSSAASRIARDARVREITAARPPVLRSLDARTQGVVAHLAIDDPLREVVRGIREHRFRIGHLLGDEFGGGLIVWLRRVHEVGAALVQPDELPGDRAVASGVAAQRPAHAEHRAAGGARPVLLDDDAWARVGPAAGEPCELSERGALRCLTMRDWPRERRRRTEGERDHGHS